MNNDVLYFYLSDHSECPVGI